MHYDVINLRKFYASSLGQWVLKTLCVQLALLWPPSNRDKARRIIAIGYGIPYLETLWGKADIAALMPAQMGVHRWHYMATAHKQTMRGNKSALVDDTELPLANNAIDQILLIHCLEHSRDVAAVIQEAWRVLAPGGRLMIVLPNRLGWWARSEKSPWCVGQTLSQRQLRTQLQKAYFVQLRWSASLFLPPLLSQSIVRLLPRFFSSIESLGRFLFKRFCGVIIVEARKQIYAPTRGEKAKVKKLIMRGKPAFVPQARNSNKDMPSRCYLDFESV